MYEESSMVHAKYNQYAGVLKSKVESKVYIIAKRPQLECSC